MHLQIRPVEKADLEALKAVLDSIELFPSEMLEDMIAPYFEQPELEQYWFTATENHQPMALGFCAPERLTEGTFNLYAIGVQATLQGKGIGKQMMAYLENLLRQKGHRVLIVETSGADAFKGTRQFYEQLGYHKEAVIRDFWKAGDDKVVYWKALHQG